MLPLPDADDNVKDAASPADTLPQIIAAAESSVRDMVTRMLDGITNDTVAFSASLSRAVIVAAATGKPEIVREVENQGRLLMEIHRIRAEKEVRERVLAFARTAAEVALSAVMLGMKGGAP